MKSFLFGILAAIAVAGKASAQGVTLGSNQLELIINPGFNHLPQVISVSSNSARYTGALTVTSDSSWVTPVWEGTNSQVKLTFATSNFVASQTATIRVVTGASTNEAFVHGTVAPLNVLKLVDDPKRSRVYGVHAYGMQLGSVLVMDPLTGQLIGNLTMGRKPTDLAISAATDELLVLNSPDKTIMVIDLATLKLKETIPLTEYGDWGPESTSGNIQIGAGNIIYYTDGNWAPVLHVFNRATRQVLQNIGIDSNGFGDFALTSDKRTLIAWAQYGWSAGWAGSYIARFSVDTAGLLTQREVTDTQYPTSIMRDPLDTPVLISSSDTEAFVKQMVVNTGLLNPVVHSFPAPIYAISPGGEVAMTSEGIYERKTGNRLASIDGNPTAQVVTSDYARLVYFVPATKEIRFVDLLQAIGPDALGRTLSPADKAIVLPPTSLRWSPLPGSDFYRVFFGENRAAVQAATVGSPEYLGSTLSPEWAFNQNVTAGHTYYWRVDAVSANSAVPGAVHEFTVSTISSSTSLVNASTLQGYKNAVASFTVSSAAPGAAWVAQGAESWITFKESSGVTPATVEVVVDASKLNVGITNSFVMVGPDTNSLISIPLRVRVEPLSLTILKSDPTSAFVYGISENTQDPVPVAYLLEIDTANELITRMLPVGSGVTDLAIHNPDGRIYVPNWRIGSLLAVNKSTFNVDRTYAFRPFAGIGYGEGDVYRISAGVKDRLVVEEMDQWVTISIFNTASGTNMAGAGVREGGGGFEPTGRYYYHGENNSSGATVQKWDVTGDVFMMVKQVRVESASYYGSRVVTVSEDGSRVFWNGSAFDAALTEQWGFGQFIYSCTPNGRYAFGADSVYDIDLRKVAFGMPVTTAVSAYNSTALKLVVQRAGRVEFFPFSSAAPLAKPTLSAAGITANSVALLWTDRSLETSFTLQSRVAGTTTWNDLPALGQNVNQTSVSGLSPNTTYQFRVKATAPVASSDWSDVLEVTTPGLPPTQIVLQTPLVTPSSVRLNWTDPANETGILVERRISTASETSWLSLGALAANVTTYLDTNVISGSNYTYRVSATNSWATTSAQTSVTVPFPSPPGPPVLVNVKLMSGLGVSLVWTPPASEVTSYEIERRLDNPTNWVKIASIAGTATSFEDSNVELNREYTYRVFAVNSVGRSVASQMLSIFTERIGCILADEFENGISAGAWASVSGGEVIEGSGMLTGKGLWFGGASARTATLLPAEIRENTVLKFSFRAGNPSDGLTRWDPSELGEGIALEYTVDGIRWTVISNLNTAYPNYSTWTSISVPMPQASWSPSTQVRWRQLRHSGAASDTWALDNLCLEGPLPPPPIAPPFLMVTSSSSRSMALLWAASPRAREYVVERASALGAWTRIATTGGEQTYFTDSACLPSTTYAYRVKAANASGESLYSTVSFGTTISQIQEWQVANLGSTSQSITATGADGISMIARYAFNADANEPLVPVDPANPESGAPLITYNSDTDCLEVTFLRRKSQMNPGIIYEVQFSDDLATWTAGGAQISVTSLDDTWELARFKDSAANRVHRFSRVAIRLIQ